MFALLRIITGATRIPTHSKKVDLGSDDMLPNPLMGKKLPVVDVIQEKVSKSAVETPKVDLSQYVTMSQLDSVVDKLVKLIDQRVSQSGDDVVNRLVALIEAKLGSSTTPVNPSTKTKDGGKGAKSVNKKRK